MPNQYSANELRQPISFLRAEQIPDDADETWHLHVKPYYQAFAFVEDTTQIRQNKREADTKQQVMFAIRHNPDMSPVESGDLVAWENRLYQVLRTKRIRAQRGQPHEFMEVMTFVHGRTAESGVSHADIPEPTEPTDPPVDGGTQTPFWDDPDVNLGDAD